MSSAIGIERQAGAASGTHGVRQRRANTVFAGLLMAVVALAPIPLASNRPFFWALWAAVVGLIGLAHFGLLVLRGEALRVPLGRLWLPAALFALLAGFLAVQSFLPVPASFVTAGGASVTGARLSLAPGATLLMLLQVATYGLFFVLMLQVAANRSRARKIALALLGIVTVHALYGLVALVLLDDSLLFFPKWAYAGFATGSFVNRNSFATFLAFGLVLGVVLALRELKSGSLTGRSSAVMMLAATALILAVLVATGSRMGLFAGVAGAGLAALLAVGKGENSRWRARGLLLAGLPIAAAIVVLLLYGAATFDRLGSLEADVNVRGDLYAQVLGMIAARPWLGYGGGAFEAAYPLFHMPPVSADLVWDKAHSTYLSLWAELGVVAGSIPILLVAGIGLDALRLYLGRRGDWAGPAAAVAVIAVAAIHSVVDFSLEIEANVFLFLAILAVGVARRDEPRQEAA